VSNCSRRIPN
jgi:hypothetical protein